MNIAGRDVANYVANYGENYGANYSVDEDGKCYFFLTTYSLNI